LFFKLDLCPVLIVFAFLLAAERLRSLVYLLIELDDFQFELLL
jgi:hypothetical protein